MARAYSLDLRERVVAAVMTGGLSRREAAARFGVADLPLVCHPAAIRVSVGFARDCAAVVRLAA